MEVGVGGGEVGITKSKINFCVVICALGEFGSVFEGVFCPDEDVQIKVAVKTMRGECEKTRTCPENRLSLF